MSINARSCAGLAVAAALLAGAPAQAEDYRSVAALGKLGVSQCLGTIARMTKFMYDADDFSYLNTWHKDDPDSHMTMTLTGKPYSDGNSLATVATAPAADGSCDASFTQLFVFADSCAKLRDSTFKEWKYFSDLGEVPLYEDPTSDSVVVALANLQSGCLVVKAGLLFFPAGETGED